MVIAIACSITASRPCQAMRSGLLENDVRPVNKNTTSQIYPLIAPSKCSPRQSRLDGSVNKHISSLKKNLASTISKADHGLDCTDML